MTVDFPMQDREHVWVGDLSEADKELLLQNLTARYGKVRNRIRPVDEITSINYSPIHKYLYVHDDPLDMFNYHITCGFSTLTINNTPPRTIDLDSIL